MTDKGLGKMDVEVQGFPPGDFIKEELEARGWNQSYLAEIMARPYQAISEIISGEKEITPETAIELGKAFGTSAELWIGLEADYRLFLASQADQKKEDDSISRRGLLYSIAPVPEIVKRGWLNLPGGYTLDDLENALFPFLHISVDKDTPPHAIPGFADNYVSSMVYMRASDKNPMEKVSMYAWAMRVLQLCDQQRIPHYNPDKFNDLLDRLLKLSRYGKDIVNVPAVLMEAGIHFVVVPHLQKTYLDGAAFMAGDNKPVIAMTLRYNRVDYFWFTLFDEIGHLFSGLKGIEGAYYDNMRDLNLKDRAELQANQYAANWLVDQRLLKKFVKNTPQLTADAITQFAVSINRHPSIVLGQLQHQEFVGYNQHRKLHEDQVRYFLAPYITA